MKKKMAEPLRGRRQPEIRAWTTWSDELQKCGMFFTSPLIAISTWWHTLPVPWLLAVARAASRDG